MYQTKDNVIRLAPPLTIMKDEVDMALQKIKYRLSTTANPHKYKGPKAFLTKYLNLEIGMIKRK